MRSDDPLLPDVARDDPFGPPAHSRPVKCLHCGRTFDSALMTWDPLTESWGCPMPGCDGKGYGYDLHDLGAFEQPN